MQYKCVAKTLVIAYITDVLNFQQDAQIHDECENPTLFSCSSEHPITQNIVQYN